MSRLCAVLAFVLVTQPAQALSLGTEELQAAEQLGCVLADDALGYLNEEEFNWRFDNAVAEVSEDQVDVIYAKALGYIDGLLFGVSGEHSEVVERRLKSLSNSTACLGPVRNTVSL